MNWSQISQILKNLLLNAPHAVQDVEDLWNTIKGVDGPVEPAPEQHDSEVQACIADVKGQAGMSTEPRPAPEPGGFGQGSDPTV